MTEDQKPSFVPFTILNGVLMALVLASFSCGIVLLVELNGSFTGLVLAKIFHWIGIIVDVIALIIGINAVWKRNATSIGLFVSVSTCQLAVQAPIVLISDIAWIYLITNWPFESPSPFLEKKIEILMWTLVVLNLVRIIIFIIILFVALNLYDKFQRITITIITKRTTTIYGPQNQESPAQVTNSAQNPA